MPVYVYRRQDGSTFEIEQRITACNVMGIAMPWLADSDVGAAYVYTFLYRV